MILPNHILTNDTLNSFRLIFFGHVWTGDRLDLEAASMSYLTSPVEFSPSPTPDTPPLTATVMNNLQNHVSTYPYPNELA